MSNSQTTNKAEYGKTCYNAPALLIGKAVPFVCFFIRRIE